MKIHAVHIVNSSCVFDMVFNVFKPLLNDFIRKRIHFHGSDMSSLHEHISPKHLPERYGGVHPDYNYNDWIKFFEKNGRIKEELRSLGYSDTSGEYSEGWDNNEDDKE